MIYIFTFALLGNRDLESWSWEVRSDQGAGYFSPDYQSSLQVPWYINTDPVNKVELGNISLIKGFTDTDQNNNLHYNLNLDTTQSWLWLVYVLNKNDPDQSWSWSILILMKLNPDKQIFLEYSRFDSKMVPEVNIIRQYIMKISALHSQSVSNKVPYLCIYCILACPSFASKKRQNHQTSIDQILSVVTNMTPGKVCALLIFISEFWMCECVGKKKIWPNFQLSSLHWKKEENPVDRSAQGYNARKVNYSCVYSAYKLKPVLWAEFVNRVSLVSEEDKSI